MFFKQVWRNAIRHRKDNGLFFGSLIIAIIAFYTLLSLKEQDVMRYLAAVESVAVSKLFKLIPLVYMVSLFFVFFLVYFACKYQTDSRRKEFGMYLMLGNLFKQSDFPADRHSPCPVSDGRNQPDHRKACRFRHYRAPHILLPRRPPLYCMRLYPCTAIICIRYLYETFPYGTRSVSG